MRVPSAFNPPHRFHAGSLTNVGALDGSLGSPEAETDVLVPSPATLSDTLGLAALALGVQEDVRLLLESALALDSQFGRHDRGDVQSVGSGDVCAVLSMVVEGVRSCTTVRFQKPAAKVRRGFAGVCRRQASGSDLRRRKLGKTHVLFTLTTRTCPLSNHCSSM